MDITTIFWDIGGVVLTNGWDTAARERAAERFALDRDDYGQRHAMAVTELETGQITLDEYLEQTVFCRPRDFPPESFKDFMFEQSRPIDGTLDVLAGVAATGRYLLGTLNNESRELNQFRLEKFGLRQWFSIYVCSSYLGVMKPAPAIFRIALDLVQRDPARVLMIDDRPLNAEAAARAGMHVIHFRDAGQLRDELRKFIPEGL
ncbi:MAG: HAD-IA family hydrolase [Gemmatimonadaceae bacterium]|nr:HAD-IA family hydrolase [Gemmatimonadaceae bacterium]